jgi:hypothetical protein
MILKLLPALMEAVKATEAFVPGAGQGKAKLDFVLGTVSDIYADAAAVMPQVTNTINRIVSLANAVGLFQKAA